MPIEDFVADVASQNHKGSDKAGQWITKLKSQDIQTLSDLKELHEEDWAVLGLTVFACRALKNALTSNTSSVNLASSNVGGVQVSNNSSGNILGTVHYGGGHSTSLSSTNGNYMPVPNSNSGTNSNTPNNNATNGRISISTIGSITTSTCPSSATNSQMNSPPTNNPMMNNGLNNGVQGSPPLNNMQNSPPFNVMQNSPSLNTMQGSTFSPPALQTTFSSSQLNGHPDNHASHVSMQHANIQEQPQPHISHSNHHLQ